MKAVAIHGLLALFALLFAYQTWTRKDDAEPPPGEISMVECDQSAFASFTLESDTKKIVVRPKKPNGSGRYWFTLESKKREEAAGGEQTQNESGAAEKLEVEEEGFLANDEFTELLKWLVPFRAVRALGKISRELAKEFEEQKAKTKMALECAGKRHAFEVGSTTYGTGARYVKNMATNEVFLIPGNVVRDLFSARFKFMQKSLHAFELSEVDEARVEAQGKKRVLLQRERHDPRLAQWVDAAQPDRRNELFGNWIDQVEKLNAKKYLPVSEQPGSDLDKQKQIGDIEALLKIDYSQRGRSLGWMEMVRVNADEEHYYARTETTDAWVEVTQSAAKLVAQDVGLVVGTEEQPKKGDRANTGPGAKGSSSTPK
ncbi:MAG: DUF4340 domain-containing protein [Deltaproteobacteria bacterium]|nr:DUF4340 domain-containing protein [Deltaproteobacteria bacterium]